MTRCRAHERRLREAGVGDDEIKALEASVGRTARRSRRRGPPARRPGRFHADRLRRPGAAGDGRAAGAVRDDAPVFRTMDAVRSALETELAEDERVFIAGVDVGAGGNVFGLTRGLADRFGARVRDTPISETAIIGLGVGAAMAGMRPVVELMYLDFLGVCFDQLLNQAAKLPFMTGGAAEMALTVRTQFGAGRSSGSQHSQSLEALLAHIPGLDRGHAVDTRRHLRPAPGRHPGPEPRGLHREPAALRHEGAPAPARPRRADREVRGRAARDRRDRRVGLADGPRGDGRRRAGGGGGDLGRGRSTCGPWPRSTWRRSSSRCTRPAGCSLPTRRSCRSASVPRSPPWWPGTASGTSMRRSSASAPRRPRRPMPRTSSGRGSPTATTSPEAIRRLVAV